jgi:hypothetical protein
MARKKVQKKLNLKPNGLRTSSNPHSAVPEGALVTANNVFIDFPGKAKPRFGMKNLASSTLAATAKTSGAYRSNLLFHSSTTLERWNGSAVSTVRSSTSAPSGYRSRFAQAKSNLYATTSKGVLRVSASDSSFTGNSTGTMLAGLPKPGLAFSQTTTSGSVFLADDFGVAYRASFLFRDANNNLIEGPMSGRIIVFNESGSTSNVELYVYIPFETRVRTVANGTATTLSLVSIRLYRTTEVALGTDPGDEMFICYDNARWLPNGGTGTTTTGRVVCVITDICPSDSLGQEAYTNPGQDGPYQNNDEPPLAKDVVMFKGHAFYLNCAQRYSLRIQMIALPTAGDSVKIGTGRYFVAKSSSPGDREYDIDSTGADLATKIERTARDLVRSINVDNAFAGDNTVLAEYASGPEDNPGIIQLTSQAFDASQWYFTAAAPVTWAQNPPKQLYVTLVRAANVVTATTAGLHGFSVGNSVIIGGANSGTFAGTFTIASTPTTSSFTYAQVAANEDITGAADAYTYLATTDITTVPADNQTEPGGVYVSKKDKPEAVPAYNHLVVDNSNNEIYRAAVTQDALFVFTAKGIYTITGEQASNFRVSEFDLTTKITAPESVVALGTQVFGVSDQGVVKISQETGVQIISRDIEEDLFDQITSVGLTTLGTDCWAVGHTTARKYFLHFPSGITDTYKVWVYNLFTSTWTKCLYPANYTTGIVDPTTDKLHFAGTTIVQERKNRSYLDYADTETAVTANGDGGPSTSVTLVSATGVAVGDTFVQGANYGRITAVNGNTLTIDVSIEWSPGAATVYKAFEVKIEWVIDSLGDPGAEKQFTELEVFLGACQRLRQFYVIQASEASSGTDISLGHAGTTLLSYGLSLPNTTGPLSTLEYPNSLRVDVDRAVARAIQLKVGVKHLGALEDLIFLGMGLVVRGYSDRFGGR